VAESYARIFRQNMFNGGMLAIELDKATIDELFTLKQHGGINCAIDIDAKTLTFSWSAGSKTCPFTLAEFDEALVRAGGWVDFADAKY
jgi:3-isopropylmalate/(R)-2-methylmalate dehydratase small subunit